MAKIVQKVKFTPTAPKPRRVAAYARVSTGKDAMLHSLASQVEYYRNFIRNTPGWEYAGVYADEAKTGTKDNRENFQRLLTDCRSGKIDHILTKSISPVRPEHRDPAGNGAGAESPGYQRVF